MLADLHMHTTFSDGVNTPEELVREAEKAHLCAQRKIFPCLTFFFLTNLTCDNGAPTC